MRYAYIRESLQDHELKGIPIALRCQVLGVSISGYHAWVKRQSHPTEKKAIVSPETLLGQAKIIREEMGYTPGYRQMHALMQRRGIKVGTKRLRRVLRFNGIIGYRFFKRTVKTTDSSHTLPVYPNLLERNFVPGVLNRAWVSDITYLPTPEGWAFLATIMDLGSRRILGWAIDTSMTVSLVLKAFNMAVETRGESAVAGTIMHSDRGTQYCCHRFQNRLRELDMLCSMSEVGQCWDNAPGESIWSSLKRETLIGTKRFDSYVEAVETVSNWINVYNVKRPHSTINMMSPFDYETQLMHQVQKVAL